MKYLCYRYECLIHLPLAFFFFSLMLGPCLFFTFLIDRLAPSEAALEGKAGPKRVYQGESKGGFSPYPLQTNAAGGHLRLHESSTRSNDAHYAVTEPGRSGVEKDILDGSNAARIALFKRTNPPKAERSDQLQSSPGSPNAGPSNGGQWTEIETTWTHLRVRNLAQRVWRSTKLQQLTGGYFPDFVYHALSAQATHDGARRRRTGVSETGRFETAASLRWASIFSYSGGQDFHALFMLSAEWVAERAKPRNGPRPTNKDITDLYNWIQRARRRIPAVKSRDRVKDLAKRAHSLLSLSRFPPHHSNREFVDFVLEAKRTSAAVDATSNEREMAERQAGTSLGNVPLELRKALYYKSLWLRQRHGNSILMAYASWVIARGSDLHAERPTSDAIRSLREVLESDRRQWRPDEDSRTSRSISGESSELASASLGFSRSLDSRLVSLSPESIQRDSSLSKRTKREASPFGSIRRIASRASGIESGEILSGQGAAILSNIRPVRSEHSGLSERASAVLGAPSEEPAGRWHTETGESQRRQTSPKNSHLSSGQEGNEPRNARHQDQANTDDHRLRIGSTASGEQQRRMEDQRGAISRFRPLEIVLNRALMIAESLFHRYPDMPKVPGCATLEQFKQRVEFEMRRVEKRQMVSSLSLWRSQFRRAGGRDEGLRLRAWVEWVMDRSTRPHGPVWPPDMELQRIHAELGPSPQRKRQSRGEEMPGNEDGGGAQVSPEIINRKRKTSTDDLPSAKIDGSPSGRPLLKDAF